MERLLAELKKNKVKLSLDGGELRASAPTGVLSASLLQALKEHKPDIVAMLERHQPGDPDAALPSLVADPENRWAPFPLTDLQHAYWLGRNASFELGRVATHLYVELEVRSLEVWRLEEALHGMIDRHDMLRCVIVDDGSQRILKDVPRYPIQVANCSTASLDGGLRAIEATRNELSHQVLDPHRWPLFDVRVTMMPGSRARLHVSLDLLILDAFSIFLFFREWHALYEDSAAALPALGASFRDYVFCERRVRETDVYRRAEDYWAAKIDSLPGAPDLPLLVRPAETATGRFKRREFRLTRPRWVALKLAGRQRALTPSGLLMALYSEVLSRWSSSPHFTLNVTVANRLAVHADVNRILGDFTSLTLLEVDRRDGTRSLADFARSVQRQFHSDLEHNQVSGVKVMQDWNRRRGRALQAAMPVVFSSGLVWTGDEEVGNLEQFGEKVYSISQTSQVWLDHHVMELDGDLVLIWDAAEGMMYEGVLDAMFSAYQDLIERIAADETVWDSSNVVTLPPRMSAMRAEANDTSAETPRQRLHAAFIANALARPEALAVVTPVRSLTYGEVLGEASAIADWLVAQGVRAGELVAIEMQKGWEQVVAVCGVHLAGAAYIPIDASLPARRRRELMGIAEVRFCVVQSGANLEVAAGDGRTAVSVVEGARAPFEPQRSVVACSAPDELAYVIFTSGTTGVPKGVMVEHAAAMNTIFHLNRMVAADERSRVLAVSSLGFDLSVWDIFGPLNAGGAIVVPDSARQHDPAHWWELIKRHRVTVWNSAPQLMTMLLDAAPRDVVASVFPRTALLSGDFIPLDTPERARRVRPDVELICLGGATEASVWSNYYRVRDVDPAWQSIPYGTPLPNQQMWVLDSAYRPCPDFVNGRIFIGGMGLARGYLADPQKTAERFVHRETGERLYDTGDLGRYAADGNIIILGRDDEQVKLRGHRVELGEIRAVISRYSGIRAAVVTTRAGAGREKVLVAYVEASKGAAPSSQELTTALRRYLEESLPAYMVPAHIICVDTIPISWNGKVDYKALPSIDDQRTSGGPEVIAPRTEVERRILEVWSTVIEDTNIGVTDNFFELGGDSVVATRLARELNAALPGFNLEMHELFETLTIESLAALYGERPSNAGGGFASNPGQRAPAPEAAGLDTRLVLDDVEELRARIRGVPGPVEPADRLHVSNSLFVTGATGWIGAEVTLELLEHTTATLRCLVSAATEFEAQERLRAVVAARRNGFDPEWSGRLVAVLGDVSAPRFGLDATAWKDLAATSDGIYHFAGGTGLMTAYGIHREVNVAPVESLVRLASEHHAKPLTTVSPMTVCRRSLGGQLTMLGAERGISSADGLLSPYAQAKWAAEQLLLEAASTLPVKIYRTSHALPPLRQGVTKPNDTYTSVLEAACLAGVIPEWPESGVYGVPVDVLARVLVRDALAGNGYRGIIHLENSAPLDMAGVIEACLGAIGERGASPLRVSLDEWKARCVEAAAKSLPESTAALVRAVFMAAQAGSGIIAMFSRFPVETGYVERWGQSGALSGAASAEYWGGVARRAGWRTEVVP